MENEWCPTITEDLIEDINNLPRNYSEELARSLLRKMLGRKTRGFDLPMASTVLRFADPDRLQIIDQRVYRIITPEADSLNIPYDIDKKIDLYFEYIARLKDTCNQHNIPFSKADRILYQMDKIHNREIPLKTS